MGFLKAWAVRMGLTSRSKSAEAVASHNAAVMGLGSVASGQPRNAGAVLRAARVAPWLGLAVNRKAEDIASVPWRLYLQRTRPGELRYSRPRWASYQRRSQRVREQRKAAAQGLLVEVTEHPLLSLLEKPNPFFDGFDLLYLLAGWLDVGGGYVAINRGADGLPAELWPIPPTWVSQAPTPDGLVNDYVLSIHGRVWKLPSRDVLRVRRTALDDPYIGSWGPGTLLADEVHLDESAAKRVGAFFDNGGLPEAVVSINGPGVGKPQLEDAKAKFQTDFKGVWNAFRLYFTTGQVDVKRLDTSFKDQDLVELRRFARDITLQVEGVPGIIVGVVEDANRANSLTARQNYVDFTLIGLLERIRRGVMIPLAAEYSAQLVPEYEDPSPDAADLVLQVAEKRPSAVTDNEVRAVVGLEPIEGKDTFPEGAPAPAATMAGDPPWTKGLRRWGGRRKATEEEVRGWVENVLEVLRPLPLSEEITPLFAARVSEWAAKVLEQLGAEASFALLNPLLPEHVREVAGDRMALVTDTSRKALRATLTEGAMAGESIPELARRVRTVFEDATRRRAEMIARTEVVRSSNWATWQAHAISGVVDERQWVATLDGRTRDTHRKLNGQKRGVSEPFTVDGRKAMYPGGFGVPGLDINERCTTVAVIEDPDIGEASAGSLGAVARVPPGEEVPYGALWKAYDEALAPWEGEAEEALVRGFARQEEALLARVEAVPLP